MTATPERLEDELAQARTDLQRLRTGLESILVGQSTWIQELLLGLAAGGHVLMEGLPGLGKTQLAKGLAQCLGVELARVQCTPDLMPADITGSELLSNSAGGQAMEFRPGPIFAHLVLIDEVNRATPKTQAALLEAMQEGQVTYAGQRHPLPRPFRVIATQNPIEIEGTYPLPEAQVDRFICKLQVGYPDAAGLLGMLEVALDEDAAATAKPILDLARLDAITQASRHVLVGDSIKQAAIELILATHPGAPQAGELVRRNIRYGASPRGLQALLRTARVLALADGRLQVAPDDLAAVAHPVLRHRLLPTVAAELDGTSMDDCLTQILDAWKQRH